MKINFLTKTVDGDTICWEFSSVNALYNARKYGDADVPDDEDLIYRIYLGNDYDALLLSRMIKNPTFYDLLVILGIDE